MIASRQEIVEQQHDDQNGEERNQRPEQKIRVDKKRSENEFLHCIRVHLLPLG